MAWSTRWIPCPEGPRRELRRRHLHEISNNAVVHFDREIAAEGMWNFTRDRLAEGGTTLWERENEYRFTSLPMRLLSFFMRGAFRKQSRQHMQDFKAFAEEGTDVRTV